MPKKETRECIAGAAVGRNSGLQWPEAEFAACVRRIVVVRVASAEIESQLHVVPSSNDREVIQKLIGRHTYQRRPAPVIANGTESSDIDAREIILRNPGNAQLLRVVLAERRRDVLR